MKTNQLSIDAEVTGKETLRYTPTGVPVQEIMLAHRSRQMEYGIDRQVDFELSAIAFGDVAEKLNKVALHNVLHCSGFLTRRWRTGITLALHISHFELLDRLEFSDLTKR
ncbi:MAG: primosomal replication protein N [Burkholderiales bacterium]|jgi:primosomal replication protein N|nr:primosomal replication protein N [Burkholderiales bacterium]